MKSKLYLSFGILNLIIDLGLLVFLSPVLFMPSGYLGLEGLPWGLDVIIPLLPLVLIVAIYFRIKAFFVCNSYKFFLPSFLMILGGFAAAALLYLSGFSSPQGGLGGLGVVIGAIAVVAITPIASFISFLNGYFKSVNRPYKYVHDILFIALIIILFAVQHNLIQSHKTVWFSSQKTIAFEWFLG